MPTRTADSRAGSAVHRSENGEHRDGWLVNESFPLGIRGAPRASPERSIAGLSRTLARGTTQHRASRRAGKARLARPDLFLTGFAPAVENLEI